MFGKGQADLDARFREFLAPQLLSGEEILGIVAANQSSAFKQKMWMIATTNQRLIMIPVSMKWEPKGDPVSYRPEDITKTQIPGTSESWGQMLKKMGDDNVRFEAGGTTYKLNVMSSGGLDRLFTGEHQAAGSQALYEFLAALGR